MPMKKEPNKKPLLAAAIFGIPGLMVAILGPFKSFGDNIKPGLGDLMNGGIGLALLIMAAVAAAVVKRQSEK